MGADIAYWYGECDADCIRKERIESRPSVVVLTQGASEREASGKSELVDRWHKEAVGH